jgi:hypothetical protein
MQRVTDWAAARPDRFPFAARPAGRGGRSFARARAHEELAREPAAAVHVAVDVVVGGGGRSTRPRSLRQARRRPMAATFGRSRCQVALTLGR